MTVIWERTVNKGRISERNRRAMRWFAVPSVALVVLGFWAGGVGLGVALLLAIGFLGNLLAMFIMSSNRNERMNPTLVIEDGELVLGTRRVRLDDVERFTTYMGSARTNVGSAAGEATGDGAQVAKALFRTVSAVSGTDEIVFGWPKMSPSELAEIRAAIEPHLPGLWLAEPEYNSTAGQ